jgi:hypothetical protein
VGDGAGGYRAARGVDERGGVLGGAVTDRFSPCTIMLTSDLIRLALMAGQTAPISQEQRCCLSTRWTRGLSEGPKSTLYLYPTTMTRVGRSVRSCWVIRVWVCYMGSSCNVWGLDFWCLHASQRLQRPALQGRAAHEGREKGWPFSDCVSQEMCNKKETSS